MSGAQLLPVTGYSGRSSFAQAGKSTLVALNGPAGPEAERVAQNTTPKTGFQKWQETMQDGLTNPAWDTHDATIKRELEGYNERFSKTPGYKPVDVQMAKAMLWNESGGPNNKSWNTRPMQIGNKGDPAYSVLKKGTEGSSLIMTKEMKTDIQQGDINNPDLNVRAGIAYLFTRMAKYETQSVVNPNDPKKYEYKVVKGDNGFDGIARKVGTTVENLQQSNPGLKPESLHAGDTLRYQKAKIETVISGWRPFDSATIANRYNAGDAQYAQKLDYILSLLPNLKRP